MISSDESFSNVAEAFVLALRSGESPSIEEFAARFPKYAADIRDEFPLILMAEQLNAHVKKESSSASTPKMIGRYRVTGEIGRGGMGRVYAATQEGLNRQVAIKVVNFSGTEQCDSLIRFQREAKSAGKMNHPNIVPVYDYGVQDQMLYFVMPRIRGLDLSRIVDGLSLERSKSSSKSLTMDWRMIAEVGAQVAGALAYAHAQGMIHRDIKPANLIMESEGRVWVTDFGLVKNISGDQTLSRTGDLIGTPRYMAPEQLRGLSDARSDIYGLGLTLYELATGRRAWDDLSGTELITRRSTLELPPIRSVNSEIPESLCTIIMKCCAFKPDDRYQTASEVQFVLNRYLQGHRVGDRRKARNGERSILKRRPIRLIRGAATLCGIFIFGGACYYATRPKNPFEDPYASVTMLKDDQVRKDFIKQIPSIIQQVVESKDAELRNAVGDVAKQTLTKELEADETIPDSIKDEIKKNVDRMHEQFVTGQVEEVGHTQDLSTNALLVQACEFDWVVPQLSESGLSSREKAAGQRLLMNLKKGILEQRVVQPTLDKLRRSAAKLAVTEVADEDPNAHAKLTDNSLRTFLGYVELAVSDRNKIDDRVVLPLQQRQSGTVVNAIDTALRNPEVRNFLNSLK
ncbi:MAG: serine/threonine-protein kinase [Pirellulaceae bacterium]|nr:serine/threonine-protein kinase [Pirellulaceae bacterium]